MPYAISPPVEKELLTRLRSGDCYAFEQLYQAYSRKIYGKLLRLTGSQALADELLQDTFVILWQKRHQLNIELSFRSWLYKVAINEVYLYYRKLSRDRELQERLVLTYNEAYDHIGELVDYKESKEILDKAIAQLPPQRKQIFTMCRLEGKSYDEVAGELGISANTVSVHMVKANRTVRSYIFNFRSLPVVFLLPALFEIL